MEDKSTTLVKEISSEIMVDALIAKAIAIAIIDYPILSSTFIKPIFILVTRFVAKYCYKVVKLENDLFFIGVKVEKELKNYNDSIQKLTNAIKEGSSEEDIKKEREAAKENLRILINFKPS